MGWLCTSMSSSVRIKEGVRGGARVGSSEY